VTCEITSSFIYSTHIFCFHQVKVATVFWTKAGGLDLDSPKALATTPEEWLHVFGNNQQSKEHTGQKGFTLGLFMQSQSTCGKNTHEIGIFRKLWYVVRCLQKKLVKIMTA
jgi:hypothetical protein